VQHCATTPKCLFSRDVWKMLNSFYSCCKMSSQRGMLHLYFEDHSRVTAHLACRTPAKQIGGQAWLSSRLSSRQEALQQRPIFSVCHPQRSTTSPSGDPFSVH
jgi:hypothetical protein